MRARPVHAGVRRAVDLPASACHFEGGLCEMDGCMWIWVWDPKDKAEVCVIFSHVHTDPLAC